MAGRCDFEGKHSDFLRRPLREQLEEGSFGISGGLAVVYSYPELVRSAAGRICGRQLARDKRRRRSSARGGEARRRRKRLRENGGRPWGFFVCRAVRQCHTTVIHQYNHQWHRWHGRHGPWCKRTQPLRLYDPERKGLTVQAGDTVRCASVRLRRVPARQ